MSDARPQFAKAWKEFESFIRELRKDPETDDAAIGAAGQQHLAYLYLKSIEMLIPDSFMGKITFKLCKREFLRAAGVAFDTMVRQIEEKRTQDGY